MKIIVVRKSLDRKIIRVQVSVTAPSNLKRRKQMEFYIAITCATIWILGLMIFGLFIERTT
jgi:hypothetical protein